MANSGGRSVRSRVRRRSDVGGVLLDLVAILAALFLACLGAANLLAVGDRTLAIHQLATVAVGVLLLVAGRLLRGRLLTPCAWICYGLTVVLLLAVRAIGVEAGGARRWLAFGSLVFQPSELAKLALLLLLAVLLGASGARWPRFGLALVLAAVPIGLVVLQPDLSTALLLIALVVSMLILGRMPARLVLPLLAGVVVVAPLAIGLLQPYQLARVQGFLGGAENINGTGWAVHQAHIAVVSGGWFGIANNPFHQVASTYLPGKETDLALASLVQQRGWLAGALAVLATLVIMWRLALASRSCRDRTSSLVCAGLAVLLGVEVSLSVGGNLGALPLAGVPFPLLSYGGTAAAVHLAALGIALGARRDGARHELWAAPRWINLRPRMMRLAAVALTGVLLVLSGYAWRLQTTNAEGLQNAGSAQMSRCFPLPAARGAITDRHGTILARGIHRAEVLTVPALLLDHPAAVAQLAQLTGRRLDRLDRSLTKNRGELTMRVATVSLTTEHRIIAARLPAVFTAAAPRRIYPYGPLVAPILGFVGQATPVEERRWPGLYPGELVGRTGLEQQYDPVLRGVAGRQCVIVDPAGQPVAIGARRAPVPGATLRTTLALGLQRQLTSALKVGIHLHGAGDLGGAVAIDPRSGQVLAMASLPSYDNNLFGPPVNGAALRRAAGRPNDPMLEHATQAVSPPGSTFKLVVASADMVHRVFPVDEVIPTGGSFTLAGHVFHNWADLAPMSLVEAIGWSNDVYFYKLAWALGPYWLHKTGHALGVGQPSGIDLPGESAGFFGTPKSVAKAGGHWYGGSTVIMGIGQGYVAVTPMQDAGWTIGVTTGRMVTPRLGLAFGGGNGYTALPTPAPRRLPFANKLGPVRAGMRWAVTGGTATLLSNLPVAVGAKTGTSEDPAAPDGTTDSWMTAAAPLHNPKIVVTCLVRGGGEGADASAPVVDATLAYFLSHRAQIMAVGRTHH